MNIVVIGKRGAGKTEAREWLEAQEEPHFVVELSSDRHAPTLYGWVGLGFTVFKVFAERVRRQQRLRYYEHDLDDGWQLDDVDADQTIGNYGSLHELHEQLADALRREEARV